MPPSTRSRTVKRVWFTLAALMFVARCADHIPAYLKGYLGVSENEGTEKAAASQGSEAEAQRALRVASWNLEWLHEPGRGTRPRNKEDYARLRHYAESMRADVFAVQEVANEVALALVFPPEKYAFHLAARGGSQRSGFVFKRQLKTTVYPDLDALAGEHLRAGADLGVQIGEHELRLLSIHLKAFCVTGPLSAKDGDCKKLKQQIPALEAWVDARAHEDRPFVVLGDFNRTLGEEDAVLIELDDGDPANLTLLRATPTRKAACTAGRLDAVDHVLLGGAATTWLLPKSFAESSYLASDTNRGVKLSDHCPLAVELRLPVP